MIDENDLFNRVILQIETLSQKDLENLASYIQFIKTPSLNPISRIQWVNIKDIIANDYNPNFIASPEKKCLLRSMLKYGITSPLIVHKQEDKYMLIDGFHRWKLISRNKELAQNLNHKVPVVALHLPLNDRIAASICYNRACGQNKITELAEIVKTLSDHGWSSQKIMTELGMEADEVLRLKQFTGLGELFKEEEYSNGWI